MLVAETNSLIILLKEIVLLSLDGKRSDQRMVIFRWEANAKKMIGDRCAISGNVPASLMVAGTPKEVKECCRKLIETCAPGGGYTLAGGCTATETKNPDNFRVFMEAAVEYGTY